MTLPVFNINSKDHLSLILFGGELTIKIKEPVININGDIEFIKSGENKGSIKCKLVSKTIKIKGLGLNPSPDWETKKKGFYKTNEDILKLIAEYKE